MTDLLLGRCLCGNLRFEADPPTTFAGHCHCESCRRAHSAAFVTWTAVHEASFRLTAGEEALRVHASSPGVQRSFCGTCGSPMHYRWTTEPDLVYFPVAALETPIDRPMQMQFSYEEHVPWLEGIEALPCFRAKSRERMQWAG